MMEIVFRRAGIIKRSPQYVGLLASPKAFFATVFREGV
jgi:hypothetical protein